MKISISNPFQKRETFWDHFGRIVGNGILGAMELTIFFGTIWLSVFSIKKIFGR